MAPGHSEASAAWQACPAIAIYALAGVSPTGFASPAFAGFAFVVLPDYTIFMPPDEEMWCWREYGYLGEESTAD
jgi:hypothetical protein